MAPARRSRSSCRPNRRRASPSLKLVPSLFLGQFVFPGSTPSTRRHKTPDATHFTPQLSLSWSLWTLNEPNDTRTRRKASGVHTSGLSADLAAATQARRRLHHRQSDSACVLIKKYFRRPHLLWRRAAQGKARKQRNAREPTTQSPAQREGSKETAKRQGANEPPQVTQSAQQRGRRPGAALAISPVLPRPHPQPGTGQPIL